MRIIHWILSLWFASDTKHPAYHLGAWIRRVYDHCTNAAEQNPVRNRRRK